MRIKYINPLFWFLQKSVVRFGWSFFLKLFKLLSGFSEIRGFFSGLTYKKLNSFFSKNGKILESLRFSNTVNLTSKNLIYQLFCFLRKNDVRFNLSYFLKLYRLIGKIRQNLVFYFLDNPKKLIGFLLKKINRLESFRFLYVEILTDKKVINQLFCFLTKPVVRFGFL